MYYVRLAKDGKSGSLVKMMDSFAATTEENKRVLDNLMGKYDKLEKDGAAHIQKIGLVRFNPFKDTGGDQSFILALVDADNTGVVISSLHTRTGTRWYAKGVAHGKGVEHELSTEELEALKGAKFLSKSE